MSKIFYDKSLGNDGYIYNLDVLAFHDAEGVNLFQPALHKTDSGQYYIYWSTFGGLGVSIFEVTDPEHPRYIRRFMPVDPVEYPSTRSPKIQIADGLLIVALSSGGGPSVLNLDRKGSERKIGGIRIFDLKKDPENPEFLGEWDNSVPDGYGVHRFCYNGGRYVHLSSDAPGFLGMIYRILDIEDPAHPVEVGRWWLPEQYLDGQVDNSYNPAAPHTPEMLDKGHLHGPPFVVGDRAYLGYSGAGLCVLDVSDLTRPKLLGRLGFQPPFSGGLAGSRCHTALPLAGRDLVVVTNEGERFAWFSAEKINNVPQPMNNLHMVNVQDPRHPTLIAEFPYPSVPEGFPYPNFNECGLGMQGPFGPHNVHEPMSGKPYLEQRNDIVYCCYFHAGLRIFDVSDPYYIKEKAYFIPPYPEKRRFPQYTGPQLATTEDIVVDDRGIIYIDAMEDGMYILRKTFE